MNKDSKAIISVILKGMLAGKRTLIFSLQSGQKERKCGMLICLAGNPAATVIENTSQLIIKNERGSIMKIKVNGYEICISAKSTFIPDAVFDDDTAACVVNQVVCILNTLTDMCQQKGDVVYTDFSKVLNKWSNELYDQLDEKGYYDGFRKNKSNACTY